MSETPAALITLRRTHMALAFVALVLLGISSIRGRDFDPALDQIGVVQDLFSGDQLQRRCGETAETEFRVLWTEILDTAYTDPSMSASSDFQTSFSAHCPHPTTEHSLGTIGAFLAEGMWVDVPSPADSATARLLMRNAGRGQLEEAFVAWEGEVVDWWNDRIALTPLTDQVLSSINAGQDSLDFLLVYAAGRTDLEGAAGGESGRP